MDANKPAQTPTVPNQPIASQAQMPGTPSTGSNKVVLWFVVGLIIIALAVGGIYFFLSKQQTSQTQNPVTQASPSSATQQDLEKDLNNINVDATPAASDFTVVDQDLQQL